MQIILVCTESHNQSYRKIQPPQGDSCSWLLGNCFVGAAFKRRVGVSVAMATGAFLLFPSHQAVCFLRSLLWKMRLQPKRRFNTSANGRFNPPPVSRTVFNIPSRFVLSPLLCVKNKKWIVVQPWRSQQMVAKCKHLISDTKEKAEEQHSKNVCVLHHSK